VALILIFKVTYCRKQSVCGAHYCFILVLLKLPQKISYPFNFTKREKRYKQKKTTSPQGEKILG
jgi:hypothetical protein